MQNEHAKMTGPNFGQLFIESKGQPITVSGRQLIMIDRLPAEFNQRFTVTIESTSSRYPQGVGISEGVEIFGERVKKAVVWEYFSLPPAERDDTKSKLPFSFDVVCRNKKGTLCFYNMTEFMGRQERWHGGSCMIASDIPGGRRYQCNDFELDDDFDDLVFTVVSNEAAHLTIKNA